ncbi:hypothetical protein [Arthrobacter sp. 18067]|uniref:hypothetical protein n=1 Tax=Arthrobacter sp. 18067 TaxID=2681413 RepID=UPI00135C7F37|nr:hypothetical protein [Arthrobacter sp. 18067]
MSPWARRITSPEVIEAARRADEKRRERDRNLLAGPAPFRTPENSALADRVIQAVEDKHGVLLPAIRQLMFEAWAEGFKQGGPMHDVNYDDPDAHTRNPYEEPE